MRATERLDLTEESLGLVSHRLCVWSSDICCRTAALSLSGRCQSTTSMYERHTIGVGPFNGIKQTHLWNALSVNPGQSGDKRQDRHHQGQKRERQMYRIEQSSWEEIRRMPQSIRIKQSWKRGEFCRMVDSASKMRGNKSASPLDRRGDGK